jgi:hypothetical protein
MYVCYHQQQLGTYLYWKVTAVLSGKIYKKLYNLKSLTMCFVGIVASGLVSGNYCNGGGAGDINALKTSKLT